MESPRWTPDAKAFVGHLKPPEGDYKARNLEKKPASAGFKTDSQMALASSCTYAHPSISSDVGQLRLGFHQDQERQNWLAHLYFHRLPFQILCLRLLVFVEGRAHQ